MNLEKLLKKSNKCHWCGKEVRRIRHKQRKGQIPPHDQATVDHVNSKLNLFKKYNPDYVVLACYPCNQKRSWVEDKFIKRNKKLIMSGQLPLYYIKFFDKGWWVRVISKFWGHYCKNCKIRFRHNIGFNSQQYCNRCFQKTHYPDQPTF